MYYFVSGLQPKVEVQYRFTVQVSDTTMFGSVLMLAPKNIQPHPSR